MYRAAVCDSILGNDLISFHSYLFWCLSQKSEVPADYDKHDPEQKQIYRFVRTLFSAAQLTAECAIVTLVSKQFSRETQSLHTFSPFLFALTSQLVACMSHFWIAWNCGRVGNKRAPGIRYYGKR